MDLSDTSHFHIPFVFCIFSFVLVLSFILFPLSLFYPFVFFLLSLFINTQFPAWHQYLWYNNV